MDSSNCAIPFTQSLSVQDLFFCIFSLTNFLYKITLDTISHVKRPHQYICMFYPNLVQTAYSLQDCQPFSKAQHNVYIFECFFLTYSSLRSPFICKGMGVSALPLMQHVLSSCSQLLTPVKVIFYTKSLSILTMQKARRVHI